MKVLLVGLNAKYIHSSLALYSIRAACRDAEYAVEVVEYTINQEFLHVLGDIAGHEPNVIGIACYIWNREMVLKLAAALKKAIPGVCIFLGGPEASGDATDIMEKNGSVDFVLQGEGEESVPELLAQLMQGAEGLNVAGIAVRRDGKIELNGGVRLVNNLDSLRFPYQADEMQGLADRIIYYESSRGCPFSCSYCVSSTTSGVRYRSIEKVKEELAFFLRHGVKQVKFVDRTFNVDPNYYREIWRFLATEPGVTNFHFEIVADRLSREDVQWLAQVPAGRFQFEIGVQSACEETLAAIGRRNDWVRLQENVQGLLRTGNIHLHLDLIVGLPHEDWGRFKDSFNAVYGLKPDMLQIGFLKLLPGTRIREESAEHGYIGLDFPPYEILSNNVLSYTEVRRLKVLEEVFNQTYNSGRFVYTLSYLVTLFDGDAFRFYNELAQWWERHSYVGKSHSPEGVLSRLLLFVERFSQEQILRAGELLKFDVLRDGSGAMKGERLNWNCERWERQKTAFWRNESAVRQYVPGYRFGNWRDVKRKYPVEIFALNIPQWITSGEWPEAGLTPILFDFTRQHPVWHVLPANELNTEDEQ